MITYSKVLTRCMLITAIGMLASVSIPPIPAFPFLPLLVPFVSGMGPLIWYHVRYLQPRAETGALGPAEVDSVYYYGFLVTIGALGCTALRLAMRGVEDNFADVALQFGLGLFATGYAVWARVHLTAASHIVSEADLIEEMKRVVENARLLGDSIQLAVDQYASFSSRVVDEQSRFAEQIQISARSQFTDAATHFRDSIKGLADEGQASLQALRAVISDVTFGTEREELRNSVLGMTQTVTELNVTLQALKTSASAGSESVGQFAHGLSQVGSSASKAHEALTTLGEKDGVVEKLTHAVEASRTELINLRLSASAMSDSFTSVSDSATGAVEPLKGMKQQSSAAVTALKNVAALEPIISVLGERLGALNERVETLATRTGQSGEALDALKQQAAELKQVIDHLNRAMIDSTGGFKDAMNSFSDEIEGRLSRVLVDVESRTAVREELILENVEPGN